MSTVPQLKIIIKLEKKTGSRKLANDENRAPPLPTLPLTHAIQDSHPNSPNMVQKEFEGQLQPRKTVLCVWTPGSEESLQEDGLRTLLWKAGLWALAERTQGPGGHQNPSRTTMGLDLEACFLGAPCPIHYTQASRLTEEETCGRRGSHGTPPGLHPPPPSPQERAGMAPRVLTRLQDGPKPRAGGSRPCSGSTAGVGASSDSDPQQAPFTSAVGAPDWDALRAQRGSATEKGNVSPVESERSCPASARKRKKQGRMCKIPQPQEWAEKCKSWHFTYTKLVIKTLIMLFAGKTVGKREY